MSSEKKRESLNFHAFIFLMSAFFGLPFGLGFISLAIEQGLTLRYAETQGTILDTQLDETRPGKFLACGPNAEDMPSHYEFKVRYAYAVGGREYTSTQVVHGVPLEGVALVQALLLRFPWDARVPVYYSEDNPSRSVLLRAPEGIHLSRLLVSFSLLTAMGWSGYALAREVRRRSRGVPTVVREGRLHVRWGLGLEGWFGLAGVSLLASILLPVERMLSLTWGGLALFFALLIAASVFVEARRQSRIRSGALDIVWDERRGVLCLPPARMAGRRTRFELPLNRLQRFYVKKAPAGPKHEGFPDWVLFLCTNEKVSPRRVPVVAWLFRDKLEVLWNGLQQHLEQRPVHPDTTWAAHTPVTRAAELASRGELAEARRALALLPVERLQDLTALLVQICLAVEAGELDTASTLLLGWDKDPGNSPHPECAMLWRFVQERRQQPTRSPIQAFALAWRRVGQPDFSDSRLLPPGPTASPPEALLTRLWSQPLSDDARVLVALAGEPNPERGRFVLEHLSDTRPPEFELALIECLLPAESLDFPSYALRLAALRPETLTALRAHFARLAAASPDAMAPHLAKVLLETPDEGPFTPEEVDQLESLARLPRWRRTDFASLYRYAFQQLEVTDSSERSHVALGACFHAVLMPMFERVRDKLQASRQSPTAERQRLGLAIQGIGERMRTENTMIEQFVGLRMLREGALLRGDDAAAQQAQALLQKGNDLKRGADRAAPFRWPLHSVKKALGQWAEDNTNEFACIQDFSLGERAPPA